MTPELLQAMASDPNAMREMLNNALAERAAGDPRLAMMMQMLNQQQAAEPPPERGIRKTRLRARVQEMRDELRILRRRNEVLAAALGACELCWGDDPECEECRGHGRPGWEEPDRALYRELISPVAERSTNK